MKAVALKKKVFGASVIFMTAIALTACSAGSPKYVGAIGSGESSQRTLDNREINSIIKELRDDVVRQKAIIGASKVK